MRRLVLHWCETPRLDELHPPLNIHLTMWRARVLNWIMWRLSGPSLLRFFHWLPSLPRRFRRYQPRERAWPEIVVDVPEEFRTVPGIWRNAAGEEQAHRDQPLHDWDIVHERAHDWYRRFGWRAFLPVMPAYIRNAHATAGLGTQAQVARDDGLEPILLRNRVTQHAHSLGINTIAVARFDRKYSCAEHAGMKVGDRVIVCVLEQSYEAMESIPSWGAERAAQECTVDLRDKCVQLAAFLQSLGYKARPNPRWIAVQYAVAAGLGQLGMNGQLLTPMAGSRCRIELISTDAPLSFDAPKDYGINGLCDACQVCARRCPPGAIPLRRREHRGVLKSKLNAARCFPTVAQAAGCAICSKVCPVQRYGLVAVYEEYRRTGQILGKGKDELEGYQFTDGRHYGVGEHPVLPKSFFKPTGLDFDASQTVPENRRLRALTASSVILSDPSLSQRD